LPDNYTKVWEHFGLVIKEGIYEDFERRDALLALARFKSTASGDGWRSLKDALKENQTAIYYLAGDDIARLENSPHLEGCSARGVEVLYLPRFRRQLLGDLRAVLRGQAVQVGDPGRRRPRGNPAA
jgi:HSP90 family molecular chaperone